MPTEVPWFCNFSVSQFSIQRTDYFAAVKSWIARLQKCVSMQGEYFEGMI